MSHLEKKVHWWPTGDPSQPWRVLHDGATWEVIVIDESGGETRYALLIEGRKEAEFTDWPESWTQAPDDAGNAAQRAEYEREIRRWERLKDVMPLDLDDVPPKD